MRKKINALVLMLLLALSASAQFTVQHPWAGKKVAYFG